MLSFYQNMFLLLTEGKNTDMMDYTDLSVCIRSDAENGKIDPRFYMDCGTDYEMLNYKRFCLALGIDGKYLKDKSASELKKTFHDECGRCFGNRADSDLGTAVVLSSLFDYTGQGVSGNYFITHDSGKKDSFYSETLSLYNYALL